MRKFLLLVLLFFFSVSVSAQIRIEKRHYNKGWYVSLNHKKKSPDEKRKIESPENSVATFQQQDSVWANDEMTSNQQPTNEPEPIPVPETSSSDSVLPKANFVSPKPNRVKTEIVFSAKVKNPVSVKTCFENNRAKSISFSHAHPSETNSIQYAPDEGWMDFAESLIVCLIAAVLIAGAIIGLIVVGLAALIALYPAATIGILVVLGLISLIFINRD